MFILQINKNQHTMLTIYASASRPISLLFSLYFNSGNVSIFGQDEQIGAFQVTKGKLRIDTSATKFRSYSILTCER